MRSIYTRNEAEELQAAYQYIFPELTPGIREYWDLDRKRAWCSLPSDFHRARFDDYEKVTHRVLEIERTITDEVQKGQALHQVTLDLGVGLSIGPGPWSDISLHETFARNVRKNRATVLVMSDCYPIVPKRSKKPHPVEAPLLRYVGISSYRKYKDHGGVPKAVVDMSELVIFLNYVPDFRPPLAPTTGPFKAPYSRNRDGFMEVLNAIARRFPEINLITYGVPSWKALRIDVLDLPNPLGILAHAKSDRGRGKLLELPIGQAQIRYLPLAHPSDTRNFNQEHAEHAHLGFKAMGLGGASCRA